MRSGKKTYRYLTLAESFRNEDGQPRSRIVARLGEVSEMTASGVASHPRCKSATGVGSFKSYQLTKEDPHPCHDEYLPSRPSAHR
ncbi:MAG: hypothetical protein ACLPXU_15330, partial [Acidimicrobiales bacterium]